MLIEFDNTVALVKPENPREIKIYLDIREATKTLVPSARYMYQHKLYLRTKGKRGWDGKTSILSKLQLVTNRSHFPTGLLPYVYTELLKSIPYKNIALNDLRAAIKSIPGTFTVPLRDYQEDAFHIALNNQFNSYDWPCGVIKIATNGGKTELAVALYQAVQLPTVFVVHRKHLINQAIRRFAKYGIHSGQVGDSVFDPDPDGITVATIQTLGNVIKGNNMERINQFIGAQMIFFDEAHLMASKINDGNQFILLSRQFRQAYYRYGLTATPFMRDQYSNQLLMGATGEVLVNITNDQLIKAGHSTKPKVKIIECPPVVGPRMWPAVRDSAIVLNRWRNNRIIEELKKAPKPTIVMTNLIAHANVLQSTAETLGFSSTVIPIIKGSTTTRARIKTIEKMQSGELDAIIVTTVFDEGLDFAELMCVILAGGGKSPIAMLQRMGRGLRKSDGKTEFILIDFKDTSGSVMKKHSAARRKVWVDEGFDIEDIKYEKGCRL